MGLGIFFLDIAVRVYKSKELVREMHQKRMNAAMEETQLYQFTKFSIAFLRIPGLWLESRFWRRVMTTIFVINCSISILTLAVELKNASSNVEITVPIMLKITTEISIFFKAIYNVFKKVEIKELHFAWGDVQGNIGVSYKKLYVSKLPSTKYTFVIF